MATLCEVSGATYPADAGGKVIEPTAGKSLLDLMENRPWPGHDYLCWEHMGHKAVWRGGFKLVQQAHENSWQLYNLEADPTETNNLAWRQREKADELKKIYAEWARQCGVK